MKAERPGFFGKLIKSLTDFFGPETYDLAPSHLVKTSQGIGVEVSDDVGNDTAYAEVVARALKTGRTIVANYNEETGKFDMDEIE